jgi:STE24 endopeptidase
MTMLTLAASAAAGFDSEAATKAWLATLNGAARAKSDAYFEGGYWLLLWSTLATVAGCWILLSWGWSAWWRRWAERVTSRRWLQPILYAFAFVPGLSIILLPWSIYTGWCRERQYGLMNLGFWPWLGEWAISLILTTLASAVLIGVIFALIRKAPRSWWAWAAGATTLLLAFAMLVAPVFVDPLFNDYKPMAAGPLRDRILAIAAANHVPADNVYVFDQSKQHKRISANVSGLGPTIRIALNDNLLNRSTPAEVEAVMGHELGHYVLGHVWRLLPAFAALVGLGFLLLWFAAPRVVRRFGRNWKIRELPAPADKKPDTTWPPKPKHPDPADPAMTPVYYLLFSLYLLALTPVANYLVRSQESQADAFGLDAARQPDGFASIAMKLSEYRKIEPSPLEEAVFFDHPSGRTRVRMAMDWKAKHLGEAPPP